VKERQAIQSEESTPQIYFPLALRKPVGYARVWVPKDGEKNFEKLSLEWFSVSRAEEAIGAIFPGLKLSDAIAWEPTHHPGNDTPFHTWRGASANLATFLAVSHAALPFQTECRHLWASGAIEMTSPPSVRAQGELGLKLDVFDLFCKEHKCEDDAVMLLPLGARSQLTTQLKALDFEVLQWPVEEDKQRIEQRLFSVDEQERKLRPLVIFFPPTHLKELVYFLRGAEEPTLQLSSHPSQEHITAHRAPRGKSIWRWFLICTALLLLVGSPCVVSHDFCIGLFKPTIGNTSLSRKGRCQRRLWVVEFCENLCILKCPGMRDKTCVSQCRRYSCDEYRNIASDSKGGLCKPKDFALCFKKDDLIQPQSRKR